MVNFTWIHIGMQIKQRLVEERKGNAIRNWEWEDIQQR